MIAVALGVFEDLSEVIWPAGVEKVSTNWQIS